MFNASLRFSLMFSFFFETKYPQFFNLPTSDMVLDGSVCPASVRHPDLDTAFRMQGDQNGEEQSNFLL